MIAGDLLLFAAGRESDVEDDVGSGDLDAWYWNAGFNWAPTSRQTMEARVGERYYGTSYFFSWTRTARRTKLDVSYTEEAVTQNNALFELGGAPHVGGRLRTFRRRLRRVRVQLDQESGRREACQQMQDAARHLHMDRSMGMAPGVIRAASPCPAAGPP